LTVKELKEESSNETEKESIKFKIEESKKFISFRLPNDYAGATAEIYVDNHFILSSTVGKKAELNINKKSKMGKELANELRKNRKIEIKV
jgi:predicted PilT family ATPase